MNLLILASGKGTRLGSLTEHNPKCLIKVNKKKVIEYLEPCFDRFTKVIVSTGFKKKKIENFLNNKGINFVYNKDYEKTNMVYSMFNCINSIDKDVIVTYSDIIFDLKIFDHFTSKTCIPLNANWKKNWLARMSYAKMISDAEGVETSGSFLKSIGSDLKKSNLPKLQFMGLIKFSYEDFNNIYNFWSKKNLLGIDMTNFLNILLENKVIKIPFFRSSFFWSEIDTPSDLSFLSSELKNTNF